ncbi:TRAP transporter fused permease subunit [uncultured Dysosmobacter sp.]|uniref:TRAP transporter permease n=1 Tax=uncultured Dysosmobacter sp. TaxID=2591384 RepID=UPI002611DCD8|nr:TRAP transporter fused permease subunit [uncultured Dysosmobacter sp.]
MEKILKRLELALCIVFVVFQLYTAYFGNLFGIAQKAVHLGLMISIIAVGLFAEDRKKKFGKLFCVFDLLMLLFGFVVVFYLSSIARTLAVDTTTFTAAMKVVGIIMIVVLMVCCWRKVGPVMSIVVAFFVFYAFFGKLFPALLSHGGMKVNRFVHLIAFTSEGIFGTPLTASATFIATFIILGSLFSVTGVGSYMCELANALLGGFRGGPAKVAVVSSALFGSISGSAVANVVGTGTFTIPLMKRVGYDGEFAGAVEATSSTGGSIMPPVMGASAFLMAEFVGVKYWDVVVAAFIPAVLYYLAILFQVDLRALRTGLKSVDRSELPPLRETLKGIWKLSPMVLLVLLIGPIGATVQRAGILTVTYTILLSFVSKETRFTKERILAFVNDAAHGCCTVAIATAAAGIIIGTVTGTGLGVRLSSVLVKLAGGNFTVLLLLTMLASVILGMGLPASACYLLLASLVAPTIFKLGAPIMAAHLFVLYFGIISNVTPPVAMAAYAAAGIANCNPSKCGMQAFKLAAGGFILPFFFVFNDVLLMNGTPLEIIVATIGAIVGIYCLACALEGYIWTAPLNGFGRILSAIAALCLISPSFLTDVFGILLLIVIHTFYINRFKRQQAHALS